MLEARQLGFAYTAQAPLLTDLNLAVGRDERVALVAPSGAGKSTLCQLLAGYLRPASGAVLLDGKPLASTGVSPVQLIWQHPELAVDPRRRLQDTLAEAGPVTPELRRRLGIKDVWLRRYPHELSGGELQRFCIARALAAQPSYIIADEISTMLDAVTQATIWQVLLSEVQERGIGLVLVTHSPALTARLATRIERLETQRKNGPAQHQTLG
jgi:peptide/nickel transport system ATP-binding protein